MTDWSLHCKIYLKLLSYHFIYWQFLFESFIPLVANDDIHGCMISWLQMMTFKFSHYFCIYQFNFFSKANSLTSHSITLRYNIYKKSRIMALFSPVMALFPNKNLMLQWWPSSFCLCHFVLFLEYCKHHGFYMYSPYFTYYS